MKEDNITYLEDKPDNIPEGSYLVYGHNDEYYMVKNIWEDEHVKVAENVAEYDIDAFHDGVDKWTYVVTSWKNVTKRIKVEAESVLEYNGYEIKQENDNENS